MAIRNGRKGESRRIRDPTGQREMPFFFEVRFSWCVWTIIFQRQ